MIARMNGDGDHDVDFLHSGHAFFPFTPTVFSIKGADGRGSVDLFVVSRMKDELIDKGDVFLEPDVVGEPMLPAIRTLVDGVGHGAGIDRGRELRIDRESRHPSCAETREAFPQLTLVARLVDRVVCRHIQDACVGRMQARSRRSPWLSFSQPVTRRAEECGEGTGKQSDSGSGQKIPTASSSLRTSLLVRRSAGDLTIAVEGSQGRGLV